MNTNLETFYNVAGVVVWLTAFPALWVSGRIISRSAIREDRLTQLLLWLVLGGFFRIPLVDLLSILVNLMAPILPTDSNMGELSIRTGITGSIVKLLLYAFGIYFARRLMAKQNIPFPKGLTLSAGEWGFIVLGMTGLMYHLIGDLIGNFLLLTFSGGG